MRFQIVIIALLLFSSSSLAANKTRFRIVTWNLEHLMSESQFQERKAFCEPLDWKDPKPGTGSPQRPESMNYCNALDGLKYPTDTRISLPLQTLPAYRQKLSALRLLEQEIGADIYALQEVRDASAVAEIFGKTDFDIYASDLDISQNVAFAIRKDLSGYDNVSFYGVKVVPEFSVADDNGHVTRPGFEATLLVNGQSLTFLNVHLKSGCRHDSIDNPVIKPEWEEARKLHKRTSCRLLRQQVPVLEKWIDDHAETNFMILGDFNRNFYSDRKIKPPRLDGTETDDPIKTSTRIGGMFFELSDGSPEGSVLHDLNSIDVYHQTQCQFGIDHFLLGKKLSDLAGATHKNTKAIRIDYLDEHYGIDKALPSDHCPLLVELRI